MQTHHSEGSKAQGARRTTPKVTRKANEIIVKLPLHFKANQRQLSALSHLVDSVERFDRLHLILDNLLFCYLLENTQWPHERDDLEDLQALLQFVSACYRVPTDTEAEDFTDTL